MIVEFLQYLAGGAMLIGAFFSLIAAVGMIRLPDLYTRMHAASKAGTMGSGLMLLSVAVISFDGSVLVRAIVGFLFLLLTAPVSAHLLARASMIAGYLPTKALCVNDMIVDKKSK